MTATKAPARHIAIYTRISQDKEKNKRAVSRQKADCELLIKKLMKQKVLPKGLRIEHYSDNSVSAFKENQEKKRTEFARMLADAEAGYVETIVAYHADRLYRRVPDLYRVARAVKDSRHLTVQTVKSGLVDFSTPVGRLAAGMLALIAEYEVEIKSVRQQSASDQIAATGDPRRGGRRPFGYIKDRPGPMGKFVLVHEEEAAEVRAAMAKLLDGKSSTSIIKDWNDRNVRTVLAQEILARQTLLQQKLDRGEVLSDEEAKLMNRRPPLWRHSTFAAVMLRYRNAGIRQHRGKPLGDASWPAIVDKDDFEKLREVLLDPSRIKGADKTRKHLLSFIVQCSRCNAGMRAAATQVPYTPVGGEKRYKRYMHYQCPGGDVPAGSACRMSITYDIAENAVKTYIADRLATPDADLLAVHDFERGELRALRQRRAELDADEKVIEKARISLASRTRQLEAIQVERVRLTAQVTSISQRVALAALLTEAVPDKTVTDRTRKFKILEDPAAPGQSGPTRVSFTAAAAAKARAMEHFENLDLEARREIIRALCSVVIEPSVKGVSYKFGRAYQRILIYPRDPISGELASEPIRASDIVGTFNPKTGRMDSGFVDPKPGKGSKRVAPGTSRPAPAATGSPDGGTGLQTPESPSRGS